MPHPFLKNRSDTYEAPCRLKNILSLPCVGRFARRLKSNNLLRIDKQGMKNVRVWEFWNFMIKN